MFVSSWQSKPGYYPHLYAHWHKPLHGLRNWKDQLVQLQTNIFTSHLIMMRDNQQYSICFWLGLCLDHLLQHCLNIVTFVLEQPLSFMQDMKPANVEDFSDPIAFTSRQNSWTVAPKLHNQVKSITPILLQKFCSAFVFLSEVRIWLSWQTPNCYWWIDVASLNLLLNGSKPMWSLC